MKEYRIFVDTNILVYAHDISAGKKHSLAKELVKKLWNTNKGFISTQILQEFFVTITSKLSKPLDPMVARSIIEDLLFWGVFINDGQSILDAINISQRHRLSFWDSLVVQSAIRSETQILLSEDLADGQTIEGVKIVNPFKEGKSIL